MKILFFVILSFPFLLSSCNTVLYPNVGQNVSLLKNRGEVNINANYVSTSTVGLYPPQSLGYSINASGAVSNHLAIHGSHGVSVSGDSYSTHKSKYSELGLGAISIFETKSIYILESFFGVGYLSVKNNENTPYDWSNLNANYLKPYIQPTLGIGDDKMIFALTPRVALVHNREFYIQSSNPNEVESVSDFFNNQKNTVVFEPGFTIQAGGPIGKFRLQYVYSTLSYSKEYLDNQIREHILSVGVSFMINQKHVSE